MFMSSQNKIMKLVSCVTAAVLGVTFLYFSNRHKKFQKQIEPSNPLIYNAAGELENNPRRSTKHQSRYLDLPRVTVSTTTALENELLQVDCDLKHNKELENCLKRLKKLQSEHPQNPTILWMIGKTYSKISEEVPDAAEKRKNIEKGIEACNASLKIDSKQANAHKWLAILIGSRSLLQPLKEKIMDAHAFKQHADMALSLKPTDFYLHFMVGRYCYDVASMKWYERKAAAALFGNPPTATFEEAFEHLQEAENLSKEPSKEIRYYLGKTCMSLGKKKEGLKWLREAYKVKSKGGQDDEIDKEIKSTLKNYPSSTILRK